MRSVLEADWFYWALAVAVGFPACLLALTEIHNALLRRKSHLARPVYLLRTYILPIGALLLLLVQAMQISVQTTPVRLVATVLGLVLMILALSSLNATLFQGAPEGSWRRRIPSIFLDVARFALITVGLAIILAVVWGANVGGLFTALGVSSIVLGLALQNSVGQIISGLLVLFEQPFALGDWIQTPTARGRVIEVNWRATHIDTGDGMLIIPNSVLANASFTNFSRPTGTHSLSVTTTFAIDDSPDEVIATLDTVAAALPQLRPDSVPSTVATGAQTYQTSIPLRGPADDFDAKATFLRWIWYAARRAGLHLDEAGDEFETTERVQQGLAVVAPTLRLSQSEREELAPRVRLSRYGTDEYLQFSGQVPTRMTFIVSGRVQLVVTGEDGSFIPIRTLQTGDFLGQTTLTREPVTAAARALDEVTVVHLEREHLEDLVARKPALLHDFGHAIEERRRALQRVLSASDD